MSGDRTNLSGHWHGLFNYPIAWPSTAFEAVIRDEGGLLTGVTTEADDTPECLGVTLTATINGRRDGMSVQFAKMYDHTSEDRDFVHYSGALHSDGNEIEGRWTIPGVWSGTFLMIRAAGTEAEEKIGAEQPIDVAR